MSVNSEKSGQHEPWRSMAEYDKLIDNIDELLDGPDPAEQPSEAPIEGESPAAEDAGEQ
jgi:hypothetical protein